MFLSSAEVKHIAQLARLRLTQDELDLYQEQLSAILEYAARLQEVETKQIQPTSSVLELGGRLRKDQPQPGLTREELLRNAPQVKGGCFRVPPVLE